MVNPFLLLDYEPALESLGDRYYDVVAAAEFPQHVLRFRNDDLLPRLGLEPEAVNDRHFIESFGKFEGVRPFFALCYHGYQFGEYNPQLGDGRGFLYGQVRGTDGELYDFGTKGSGRTPYSRGADGRLTLKGGVREVLAAEMLHRLGVRTSRCLSLIETGEQLWRGDEPSPTRSSVMVRFSRSHVRFGTFERLRYLRRPDLIEQLLDHVIEQYYSHLMIPFDLKSEAIDKPEIYAQFYTELVRRVAELAAQWMAAGFCHAVLNTDNMSITGESFDYGPYAFIPTYDLRFTAAYFDYYGRYCYGYQPSICKLNLELLQEALQLVIDRSILEDRLQQFDDCYRQHYRDRMMARLGFDRVGVTRPADVATPLEYRLAEEDAAELLQLTLKLLSENEVGYHDFFIQLRQQFCPQWRDDMSLIFADAEPMEAVQPWRSVYHRILQNLSREELDSVASCLQRSNSIVSLVRSEIERVWEPIVAEDNWQPFYDLLKQIRE